MRYSSRDGHAEGEHVNRGRDTPIFCPSLQALVCGRNLITGLTSAASPRVDISSTCKARRETWGVSPSVDMLPFGVTIPTTVPQRSEILEGLLNYPVVLWTVLVKLIFLYNKREVNDNILLDYVVRGHTL